MANVKTIKTFDLFEFEDLATFSKRWVDPAISSAAARVVSVAKIAVTFIASLANLDQCCVDLGGASFFDCQMCE